MCDQAYLRLPAAHLRRIWPEHVESMLLDRDMATAFQTAQGTSWRGRPSRKISQRQERSPSVHSNARRHVDSTCSRPSQRFQRPSFIADRIKPLFQRLRFSQILIAFPPNPTYVRASCTDRYRGSVSISREGQDSNSFSTSLKV